MNERYNAQEKYSALFDIFPNAQIDTDNDGQVIVYTNCREEGRDANNLVKFLVEMDGA